MKKINSPRFAYKTAGILLLFTLASCGSVPVSSMYKLRNFDIQTTNLAKFYAAVRIPQSLSLREKAVAVELGFSSKEAGIKFKERIYFQQYDNISSPALKAEKRAGYKVSTYRMSESDAEKMRQTRARVNKLRKQHSDGKGSLSIVANTCRHGELPAGPLYLSTYIKSDELDDFVVLVLDADIKKIVVSEKDLEEIPLCGNS